MIALVACGGKDDDPVDTDTGTDAAADTDGGEADTPEPDVDDDIEPDAVPDVTPDVPEDTTDVTPDVVPDAMDDADADADVTMWPEPLEFALNWPIFDAPADPLAGTDVESCPIYEEEICDGGTVRRCDIYDTDTGAFDDDPDAMLRRAYLYDRWYELYASPDGQSAERHFNTPMEPGTPESEWGDPANFASWGGEGDSAIWTGTALNGFILRYLHTGTEADYQRMEEATRVMLHFFDVTRIPGYLARHHYLLVPDGTPNTDEHMYRYSAGDDDQRDIEDPDTLDFLPDVYGSGLGTPRWSGDPSIDQMNGPMVAFPMVYGLLRDETLREQIAYQMTCYLHRLRRIELINLQENEDALAAFQEYFAGGGLNLDPDDIQFDQLDTIVMYVHPQINTANEDRYDRECGDFIQMEPWRVIDAASPLFIVDVLDLVQDIAREENRPNQINHFYIP
ncbi:MAG: hypothetical protein KDA28_10650, partial [Phycisphaerales bacterium]|nr:hypothetical protein [Phycisphaerales bacterium]